MILLFGFFLMYAELSFNILEIAETYPSSSMKNCVLLNFNGLVIFQERQWLLICKYNFVIFVQIKLSVIH